MVGSSRSRRQRTKTKHYTDDDPSTFTTKEKKGVAAAAPTPPEKVAAKKRLRPRKSHCPAPPPPPAFTCINHYMRIAPLFQPIEPPHSVITGRGLGVPPPLKTPHWQLIPQPKVPSESQSNNGSINNSASCTSFASDDTYLALGDTAGFVSIYTLIPKLLVVTRLTTSASIRETLAQETLPPSKKFGLYQKKSHPNQIDKIGISSGKRIVVATKQEVELVDIRTNSIVWSFPLELPVHWLDIHPQTYQVLCSFVSDAKNESPQNSTSSPLWLMETTDAVGEAVRQKVIQPVANNGKYLPLGNRCAAIWDKSSPDSIIMVTLVQRLDDTYEQELLQLHTTDSTSKFSIRQQIVVPNKPAGKSACHTVEAVSQSRTGHLTLVSSTKGIQLVETATFQILRVFGDSVALHGHSLQFQQACFVPKTTHHLLSLDEPTLTTSTDSANDVWIMGVPFFNREPREFRDTLHLWDLWDGKRTFTTLLGPPKTEGFISVECFSNQILVTTQTGQMYCMSTTFKSDFGGIMYPPGYQVINDNVEYIEDEDEVDVVVMTENIAQDDEDDDDDAVMDDEVTEALRLSMMEQVKGTNEQCPAEDESIDVVSGSETQLSFLPCHPEPYLKQILESGSSPISMANSDECVDQQLSFVSSVLLPMPYLQDAMEANQGNPLSDEPKSQPKLIRAKRSKAASLEALLRSSLDPDLRRVMLSRQVWADGSGSHLASLRWSEENTRRNGTSDDGAASRTVTAHHVVATCDTNLKTFEVNGTIGLMPDSQQDIMGDDSEKVKMDAVAALLMSANGELDNPGQSDTSVENVLDQSVDMNIESGNDKPQETVKETKKRAAPLPICFACRGRFVLHICTKKEKPVDYEEIAKADEERKEKEEEEKRKVRAEKRRLADAKRREARKKKKMEEDTRNRREEVERVRFDKENRQQEAERSRLQIDDKDRRRADMLLRLQAEQEQSAVVDSPSVVKYAKEKKPKSPLPHQQAYSKSQADWPLPSGHDETARVAPTQNSFSADWPPPSSHAVETTAPFVADWPPTARQHSSNATITGSEAFYRGAQGWPPVASNAAAQVETNANQRQHGYAVSAPSPGPDASGNVAGGDAQSYSTGFYQPRPTHVGSVPLGRYYTAAPAPATCDAPASAARTINQEVANKEGQAYSSTYYTSASTNLSNLHSDGYFRPETAAAYEDAPVESASAAGRHVNQQNQVYASSSYRLGAAPDASQLTTTNDCYYSSEPAPADKYFSLQATGAPAGHHEYYSSAPAASENDEGRPAESTGQPHAYSNNYYNEGQRAAASSASDPYYNSVSETPAAISTHYREDAGTAYGSSSYYSSGTPKATSETLDPAEALASLAMFATAAPMVSVDKYADEESSYSGIGQYHHGQEVYEQESEGGYAPNSNGWSKNNAIVDKTHQGTSN